MKGFNDAGMTREEIASTYQTELEQVNATLSNSNYRACHDLCNDYKTLLEKGIQHFSKPPNTGLMSRLCSSETNETMAHKIGYKRRELHHCTELKEARLKKTRKRKRKKTRKRKKPVSKSKKRNKSKSKKR